MVEFDPGSGKEKNKQVPLLRDMLVEYVFKPGRAIPPSIDSLDLGVFQDEAMQLANSCLLDAGNRDSGKLIYVTGDRKVLVPIHPFQSRVIGVLPMSGAISAVKKEVAEKEKLRELYLAMIIHSYGNTDLSFSAIDLLLLMLGDSEPRASVASLIAGRTKNMLFFRGENAPQLDEEEAEKKAKLWIWQLKERIGQFIKLGMNKEEVLGIVDVAGKTLLRQICAKYDLQFFSGETDSNIVTKQTL